MLDQSAEVAHVARDERFIRLPEVIRMTGMSRTAIYMSIQRREFPAAIEIGLRSRAWLESRVRSWMAERVNASRRADAEQE
jgi:prophage regulatory protein